MRFEVGFLNQIIGIFLIIGEVIRKGFKGFHVWKQLLFKNPLFTFFRQS